jgi:hypothetical protein
VLCLVRNWIILSHSLVEVKNGRTCPELLLLSFIRKIEERRRDLRQMILWADDSRFFPNKNKSCHCCDILLIFYARYAKEQEYKQIIQIHYLFVLLQINITNNLFLVSLKIISSSRVHISSNELTVSHQLDRMWEEIVWHIKVISQHLHKRFEENHGKIQSGYPVYQNRSK